MISFRFVHNVIFLWCFYSFGLGRTEKTERALLLTKLDKEFYFTKPNAFNTETKSAHFEVGFQGKTYLYCKHSDKHIGTEFLQKIEKVKPSTDVEDSNKCEESAQAVFVKVKNPILLKNIIWNGMEFYRSGYMLKTNAFQKMGTKLHLFKNELEYEHWDSNYKFVLQMDVTYFKPTQQVVALEYKLLSTNLPIHDTNFEKYEHKKTGLREKIPLVFTCNNLPDYSKIFEGKLSDEWMKRLSDEKSENRLIITWFASNIHFPLPLWERPIQFDFNMLPMWSKPYSMWQKVQKFARIVAKHIGDLAVTAGITDTMTLSNVEVEDKEGFKFPKYLWNVYEIQIENESFGIIIVLNYNSFEKTDVNICETDNNCNSYGWIIGNEDFHTGKIYCCKMTEHNISHLKASYLSLEEKPILNLKERSYKHELIKTDYFNQV